VNATGDLSTPADVHDLVTRFYREIVFDERLEPVFGEVAEVDWAEHIPKLIDYWCWILFGTGGYLASVTKAHRRLHELAPIGPDLCDRWSTFVGRHHRRRMDRPVRRPCESARHRAHGRDGQARLRLCLDGPRSRRDSHR